MIAPRVRHEDFRWTRVDGTVANTQATAKLLFFLSTILNRGSYREGTQVGTGGFAGAKGIHRVVGYPAMAKRVVPRRWRGARWRSRYDKVRVPMGSSNHRPNSAVVGRTACKPPC